MQMQVKEIYGRLQDELSVKIFENRLLYSLTGSGKYIVDILTLLNHDLRDKCNVRYQERGAVVVYGAGDAGSLFAHLCDRVNIVAFCDRNKEKHGTLFCNRPVISLEGLKEKHCDKTVVIAVHDRGAIPVITENLLRNGFTKEQILLFGNDESDGTMKELMLRQYFDIEPIAVALAKRNDMIFIDAGCYDCGTSVNFADRSGGRYKKIIAFEPEPCQYLVCVENSQSIDNIEIYPYGLWSENAELHFKNCCDKGNAHVVDGVSDNTVMINAVKLDDILRQEDKSCSSSDKGGGVFIKMDVEGAELNALKGAEQTILKHRPKLAICVYHKPEDIWEIPAYILSLHKDYKLYFRHYSQGFFETVLYAV